MFPKKLKMLRTEKGLTQTELAKQINEKFNLNIDRSMVSKWETGFQVPVMYTIKCLAQFFDVSIDYLNDNEQSSGFSNEDMNIKAAKVALFGGSSEVTDEMWQEVVNFAKFIEAREAEKNKND